MLKYEVEIYGSFRKFFSLGFRSIILIVLPHSLVPSNCYFSYHSVKLSSTLLSAFAVSSPNAAYLFSSLFSSSFASTYFFVLPTTFITGLSVAKKLFIGCLLHLCMAGLLMLIEYSWRFGALC